MSRVVLFGLGRGADVAYRLLAGDTEHEIVAFTADAEHINRKESRGLPVVPFEEVESSYPPEDFRMLILLGYQGMNRLRQNKYEIAKAKGYTLESYVASNIFRVEPIKVGENCIIMDNQSISLDVEIGNNVVMWSSNHVGDLTKVKDHAWLASHVTIAAGVTVGERAFLGVASTVSNQVSLGAETFVGASVLVSADTEAGSVHLHGHDASGLKAHSFMRLMTAANKL